jgi:hypothetical protein
MYHKSVDVPYDGGIYRAMMVPDGQHPRLMLMDVPQIRGCTVRRWYLPGDDGT